MGTADTAIAGMARITEAVFWQPVTYKTVSINAKYELDATVETQTGIIQADALFKINKEDLSIPPQTGDAVTIGSASYRIGDILPETNLNYFVIGNKIG